MKAMQQYIKALSVFVWFDRDKATEDMPLINSLQDGNAASSGTPEEQDQVTSGNDYHSCHDQLIFR
jgi:hypothetical protein